MAGPFSFFRGGLSAVVIQPEDVKMRKTFITAVFLGVMTLDALCVAQSQRVASPPGSSATELGGKYTERQAYAGGKWLELTYGRPIKRGRNLFGSADYAEALKDGAPVWRAGANVSTRLVTELPIVMGGKTVPPGQYTLFIDLQPQGWTLIVSTWPAQTTYDPNNKTALFGAYGYTPDRDLVRVPMTRETLPHSFDQLSWQFIDVTETGGSLAIIWDKQMASAPFTLQN
jgi:hypothetical protein